VDVTDIRDLCQKLHLKAESQEIDRIIEGFSARYYECNPTTVLGTPGVVHTVTAAMLMLNTDLHIAELSKHMSRADFVRNAMRAIQESMPPSADRSSTPDLVRDDSSISRFAFGSTPSIAGPTASASVRAKPPTRAEVGAAQRSASAPYTMSSPGLSSVLAGSDGSVPTVGSGLDGKARGSSATVSSFSYSKAWESEAENALKVGVRYDLC
jgi:PH/SEC7 domain-containing protein